MVRLLLVERGCFCDLAGREQSTNPTIVNIVADSVEVEGFQTFVVSEWVYIRARRYKTITVFTGNPNDKIKVCIIDFLKDDPSTYGRELHALFSQMERDGAKPKSTKHGTIMITDLSSLPPSLSTLQLPDGDYDEQYGSIRLALNLRRFGCTGRTNLALTKAPTEASRERFYYLFLVHDSIPFEKGVVELALLIQRSLFLFGLLERQYVDGLLCDNTVRGLQLFSEYFGAPSLQIADQGIDRNIVASLLSKITSTRHKLASIGLKDVPKDPFASLDAFLSAIRTFQQTSFRDSDCQPSVTSLLDVPTVQRIEKVYLLRAAMPKKMDDKVRALKSKVGEVAGVANHILSSSSADSETQQIEILRQNATIESLKYLFYGSKMPRRGGTTQNPTSTTGDPVGEQAAMASATGSGARMFFGKEKAPKVISPTAGFIKNIRGVAECVWTITKISGAEAERRRAGVRAHSDRHSFGQDTIGTETEAKCLCCCGDAVEIDQFADGATTEQSDEGVLTDGRLRNPLPLMLQLAGHPSELEFFPYVELDATSTATGALIDNSGVTSTPPFSTVITRGRSPTASKIDDRETSFSTLQGRGRSHSLNPVSPKLLDSFPVMYRAYSADSLRNPRLNQRSNFTEMDFETYTVFDRLKTQIPDIDMMLTSVEGIATRSDIVLQSLEDSYRLRQEKLDGLASHITEVLDAQKVVGVTVDSLENRHLKSGYESSVLEDKGEYHPGNRSV
ncbi:hypothetical protein HDU93_001051 [Gonapodya sp. JEL0774]|nr:hypothetical protein HDU93_001051 [Gonapodya sp. JEL0774]